MNKSGKKIEVVEKIDMEKYMLIVSNFDTLFEKGYLYQRDSKNNYQQQKDYQTCKTLLYNFLDNHNEDGTAKVLYCPIKTHPQGRLWSQTFSTQGISRQIRHTICDGLMVDIDIKNAHPTFLSRLCLEHNLSHPYLKEYLENRDKVLDHISGNRDDAKQSILSIINGLALGEHWHPWLVGFHGEMRSILSHLPKLYPEEYKMTLKIAGPGSLNLLGRCMNRILTAMERSVLDQMYSFCSPIVEVGALCHDGLMLHYKDGLDYDDIARRMTEHCGIKIVVKPMDEKIPLDNLILQSLDRPYLHFSNDFVKECLNSNIFLGVIYDNTYPIARLFDRMNPSLSSRLKYVRGSRNTNNCWYERLPNGRWFETQSLFQVSSMIATQFPPLLDRMLKLVNLQIKKKGENEHLLFQRKSILKNYQQCASLLFRSKLIEELKILYVNDKFPSLLDAKPHLIGFENGVFDVEKNQFRAIGEDDFIMKSTGYDYPFHSNPEKRKKMLSMLKTMFVPSYARRLTDPSFQPTTEEEKKADEDGEADFLFLMIIFSSTLIGMNLWQLFYILIGEGANGKSVIVSFLKKTFGDYACNLDISAFTQKNNGDHSTSDMPKTKGCHLLFVNESEHSDRLNASCIKTITGNDEITKRALYRESITFTPMFSPFLLTNSTPHVKIDDAIARRIQMILFPFRFASTEDEIGFKPFLKNKTHFLGKDPLLGEKLMEYRGEFFLFLVEIYNNHVRNKGKLEVPQRHKDATSDYIQEQDTFRNILEQYYETATEETNYTKSSDIFSSIQYDVRGMTLTSLGKELSRLGYKRIKKNDGYYWNVMRHPLPPAEETKKE